MMFIENKFEIGQIVYLKTDTAQDQHIVTRISVSAQGVTYNLNRGSFDSWHYDFEISTEKNILIDSI